MAAISDSILISQVVIFQNKQAFDSLVKKYQSPIRRFFLNLTAGNGSLSDDLAQETFIKVYNSLNGFLYKSSFSTWLFRIACNVFYDYIRSHKESQSLESAEQIAICESGFESHSGGIKSDIHLAMEILKPNERICITLFYMEDRPIEQVALMTGMPQGTVKSHLSRAKNKMAIFLKDNGY